MQINNSAFNYGQSGLQTSLSKLDESSRKVADASTSTLSSDNGANTSSDIQEGLIESSTYKLEAQANAKVLETANTTIGTLLDITV